MKLTIESDGTLSGTKLEFAMTGEEIPRMIEAHNRKKRLRRRGPPDVVTTVDFFAVSVPIEPMDATGNWPIDSSACGG